MLSNEEAWLLFQEAAGDCVENADLHETAKEMAMECGGQPIAILALGKALANREKSVWEDAILQLKKSTEMLEKVQSSIILSYNLLGTHFPQAQRLILLCSLFPKDENIPIEELVKYSIGLELFDEDLSLEEGRNRVFTLVSHLKSRNLLLDCDDDGKNDDDCVKMHDIVREVCLLLASDEQHSYLVRHESKMESWPHGGLKNPILISLMSDVMDQLPTGLDYPNLRFFQLKLNVECIKIPGDFFCGMKELRTFKYEGYREKHLRKKRSLIPLPPSIQFLTSLRVLLLEFCKVEGDISLIGSLKGLEILSFFKSQLDELPSEVRELRNLKLLDLRCDNSDLKIGISVLSCLEKLEVLYMGNYESWKNNVEYGENNISIMELESLSCLTDLQIKVPNSMILLELKEFFFENLKRFEISIDFGYSSGKKGITKNSLCLGDVDLSFLSDTKIHSIVSRTQSLEVEGCDKGKFIINASDLARGVLNNLESLVIEELTNLIEIFNGKIPDGCFHRLQKLRLAMLPALTHLWTGPTQPPSLGNLRVLDITDCESIKSLFSPSVAKCMVQLEELKIGFCFELGGVIFRDGEEENNDNGNIEFPKLNYLSLDRLPKLNSFYPESSDEDLEEDECCTVQPLFSERVMFPSLDKMEIQDLNNLEQILNSQLQEEGPATKLRSLTVVNCEKLINLVNSNAKLQNLEELYIDNCESMEAIYDFDGQKANEELTPFEANKLESLRLIELASLTHVWKNVPRDLGSFWNLKTIDIYDCEELRYLVTVSMAKMLVNLEVLNLSLCNGMKSVIGEDENDSGEQELEEGKIVFCQLKVLRLEGLGSLTSFCSSKIDLEFPLLDNVKIKGCYSMEIFSGGEVKTPKLEEPDDDADGKLWIWEGDLNNGVYRG